MIRALIRFPVSMAGWLNDGAAERTEGLKPERLLAMLIGPAEAVPLLRSLRLEIF